MDKVATRRKPVETFTVLNPRGIRAGVPIIKFHTCDKARKDPDNHAGCDEQSWMAGDRFDPPTGFGLERFTKHLAMPGATCADDHQDCAGPFLGEEAG